LIEIKMLKRLGDLARKIIGCELLLVLCSFCCWRLPEHLLLTSITGGGSRKLGACPVIRFPGDAKKEVSDALPFELIARKYSVSAELLALAVLDPHPRMNVTLTPREARDLARFSFRVAG
jgi:hypothetical protein